MLYRTPDANLGEAMITLQPVWKITPASLQVWQFAGKSYRGVVTLAAIGQGQYHITTAIDMDFHRSFWRTSRKAPGPSCHLLVCWPCYRPSLVCTKAMHPFAGVLTA
ncbi:MAG: hypothetical protein COW15_01840 [Shewanella sp. CG12_big_fil_rev_8_21_14_0_65_47_15]|nr:MAG: hypothetical protein COW15_01840 [Shewanella sp. CG12_big_fil_rev_8_21_14_0_65_47_15]